MYQVETFVGTSSYAANATIQARELCNTFLREVVKPDDKMSVAELDTFMVVEQRTGYANKYVFTITVMFYDNNFPLDPDPDPDPVEGADPITEPLESR